MAPDVEIVWRAFELRPAPAPTLDPRGEYLTRVWRDAVYPLAARLGFADMRLPTRQPRSRLAHEAAKWAAARGRFDDYNEALFRAFFARDLDIGDAGVLVALAAELGMKDAEGLSETLSRGDYTSGVLADEGEAARLGISGVPAFVADRRALLTGVQTAGALAQLVERVSAASDSTFGESSGTQPQEPPVNIRRRGDDG